MTLFWLIHFSYNKLGNVSENIRTFALPFEDSVYNFRMMFEYDSWNRVQRIVYPDSEVVTYNYDLAGNLNRVHTYKANHRDTLIKNILYDEFGHRTQVNFGNGVTTNYTYDILQRLSTLQTYSNNASLQKILYSFDLEDNITKVENTASGANGLGGAYVNTYNYDGLYRLTAANGSYSGNNTNYSLEMSYTPAGRLCSKLQDFTATANTYAYSQNAKPHAVRRYYNGLTNELYNLRWDNNGNLAQQMVYSVANNATTYMRYLQWDEDDRLNLVAGDGYLSYYTYGHDGNRAIKMTGNAAIDQTGTLLNSTNLENITIYPNEYLTVTQGEYTKYYYAGGNRIASKIGTGGFEKMTRLCTLDQGPTYNANNLLNFVLYQVTNISNQPTDEYPVDVCGGYSVSAELLADPLPDFYISQTNLNFTQNNLLQQFRQNLAGGTEPVYYFHSDHLGSASWITDGSGLPVQHLQYLPFGEHFVNEHSSGYDERFTFTGKERDAETGYYYHGARFNSSDIGWLSVDPMADKYPSLTPYNYCAWNPVKLVDPEGEEISPIFSTEGKLLGTDNEGYGGKAIVMEESVFWQGMDHMYAESLGTYLEEYGSSISISDGDWNKVVVNGGERQIPYLSNKTDERIFYKPDKSLNGFLDNSAYPCEPHMDIYMPIDGVKTAEMKRNEVFKVVDGTRVIVRHNPCIPYTFGSNRGSPRLAIDIQFSGNFWDKIKQFGGNIISGCLLKNAPDSGWNALRDAFVKQ